MSAYNKRSSTSEFIEKSLVIHGTKYDYSKVVYTNAHTKVSIMCKNGHEFLQKPNNHLAGKGCGLCAKSIPKPPEDFLAEAIAIHGDRYNYSITKYVEAHSKVDIKCNVCYSVFSQTPRSHLNGSGCPICAKEVRASKKRMTLEAFKLRAATIHSGYTYISLNGSKINFICPNGHEHTISASSHLTGVGCGICKGMTYGNLQLVMNKLHAVHGDTYDYSNVVTTSSKSKISIGCKKHGFFVQELGSHLSGTGCPECAREESSLELQLLEFIKQFRPDAVSGNRKILGGKELDIYIDSDRLAFEFNGLYFHSDRFENAYGRHKEKSDACTKLGIRLIHIFEDDWLFRRNVVENFIRSILSPSEKPIGARKLTCKQVEHTIASEFYNLYHIQGSPNRGHHYGLFLGDELYACSTFCKAYSVRGSNISDEFELVRYASKSSVIGGVSKAIKYFSIDFNPSSIISYCDNSMYLGGMYLKSGFTTISTSKPDYKVIVKKKRVHKSNFTKDKIAKNYPHVYDKNKTEREMLHELGFFRIYNSGLTKYKLTLPLDKS